MSKTNLGRYFLAAATIVTSTAAYGQIDLQVRARQLPGWDARAREGHCQVRVWVDHVAEVRMRGDTIFVRTVGGAKARDEGSECSQPMPFNSVRDFQIHQTTGRNRVVLTQEPGRMNNYTALVTIEDAQGGGDNYTFDVTWRAEADVTSAPAPFFDDVRACQDMVRQRFLTQNGRGAYVDFDNFPNRQDQDQDRGPGRGRLQRGNGGQESIQGRGSARRWNESRDITYTCVIDTRQNQVMSVAYQYSGDGVRMNDRPDDRKPLR